MRTQVGRWGRYMESQYEKECLFLKKNIKRMYLMLAKGEITYEELGG